MKTPPVLRKQMFIGYHRFVLVIFAVAVAFAAITIFNRRHTSATYNARLLPFAYFSLGSWIFWIVQYFILLAGSPNSSPRGVFQSTGLVLGMVQNALWAIAVLSLYSKQFSRVSLTLPSLVAFTAITASVSYKTTLLAEEPFAQFDAVVSAVIMAAVAYSIWPLGLNKIFAVAFLIHALSVWIWRYLWFTPFAETQVALVAFPLWHIALLVAWIILILKMLVTFRVMLSSTIEDLAPEREAVDHVMQELNLERFRSETFGGVSGTPEALCASWAKQCDIFILLIGERYGYLIKSKGISVVEYEYDLAHAHDPGKILVYVKDGVIREARLDKFLDRLKDFEHGHVTYPFTTPEGLCTLIQRDLRQWLLAPGLRRKKAAVVDPS